MIFKIKKEMAFSKNNKELVLRNANLDDIEHLVILENQSFSYDQLDKQKFKRFIKNGKDYFLIVEHNKEVIAYLLALSRKGSKKIRVYSICTSESYRGEGIARLCFEKTLKDFKRLNVVEAKLEVKKNNLPGIKLYESLGFKKTGEIEQFYSDGETAHIYKITLAS